jgi:hypothetical protein
MGFDNWITIAGRDDLAPRRKLNVTVFVAASRRA